jgi:DNA-directed RNA polymerase subunit H (RpoH/RPB5)
MDSNSTIKKINKSRINLKSYLSEEWKTEDIKDYSDIRDVIRDENLSLEDSYNNYHFKNIHTFHLDTLSIDILKHSKVPKHEVFRFEKDIKQICEKCNCRKDQFPIIERNDAVAKRLRIAPGDICKITRISQTAGETEYYRVCK